MATSASDARRRDGRDRSSPAEHGDAAGDDQPHHDSDDRTGQADPVAGEQERAHRAGSQNGGTRAAPASTWTPTSRPAPGRPRAGPSTSPRLPVPAIWSISGWIQHRTPSTSDQRCRRLPSTRRRPGRQHEPDETGERTRSGRVCVREVGLDDQAGEHDGDRARRCPRPPTSPRSATAGRTAAAPGRSAAGRRSARTGRAWPRTASCRPSPPRRPPAETAAEPPATPRSTLAALINAEPIAVPR